MGETRVITSVASSKWEGLTLVGEATCSNLGSSPGLLSGHLQVLLHVLQPAPQPASLHGSLLLLLTQTLLQVVPHLITNKVGVVRELREAAAEDVNYPMDSMPPDNPLTPI